VRRMEKRASYMVIGEASQAPLGASGRCRGDWADFHLLSLPKMFPWLGSIPGSADQTRTSRRTATASALQLKPLKTREPHRLNCWLIM
jgi:hypothetical protein